MIGVDTNILVRLFVIDDAAQNASVRAFFAERDAHDPAYVSAIVLAETIWLLRKRYGYSREIITSVLSDMLSSDDFLVEHGEQLAELLERNSGQVMELTDHLIAWSGLAAGCTKTITFDRRSARAIPTMELLA